MLIILTGADTGMAEAGQGILVAPSRYGSRRSVYHTSTDDAFRRFWRPPSPTTLPVPSSPVNHHLHKKPLPTSGRDAWRWTATRETRNHPLRSPWPTPMPFRSFRPASWKLSVMTRSLRHCSRRRECPVRLPEKSRRHHHRDAQAIRRRPGPESPSIRQGQLLPVKSASAGQCLAEYNSELKEGYLRVRTVPPPKTTM